MKRKSSKGCKYHPPRISVHQKMLRQKAYEEYKKKKEKDDINPIDTSKSNWSSEN